MKSEFSVCPILKSQTKNAGSVTYVETRHALSQKNRNSRK